MDLRFLNIWNKKRNYLYINYKNFDNIIIGGVYYIESLFYRFNIIKKQFFIGLCISLKKRGIDSSFLLRNVINGCLINKKILIFDPLILKIQKSSRRFFKNKKSKLYYILKKPTLYRMNKILLKEIKNF